MESETVFDLRKFQLNELCDHAAICMVAKRASGKSWVVRDIMSFKRDIPCGIVIAPTDKLSGFYDSFVPSCYIHYEYRPEILTRLFRRQERIIEKNRQRIKNNKAPIDTRAFLIMDDCLAQASSWIKDENIAELMCNGRHYHITFVLTMQYSLGITPSMRSNFDYVFLLGEDFINNRKKLFEHYAGMFPTFGVFQQVFAKVTHDYGCMVLNNRIKSANIQEKIFWYRADEHKDFTIGSERYQLYHRRHFDPNWAKRRPRLLDADSLANISRRARTGGTFNIMLKEQLRADQ